MRESLHPGDVDACGQRDLLDGCARAYSGLNLLGRQHVWNLCIGSRLAGSGFLATHGGAQPVVSAQDELLVRVVAFANYAFAINVESDDLEFPHADLLRAPVAPGRRARLAGHPTALSARNLADTPELPGQSRSTSQSTHCVSDVTSSGSTAVNMAIRSWLRPSLRYGSVSTIPLAPSVLATAAASTSSEKSMVPTTCERCSRAATNGVANCDASAHE